MLLPWLAGEAVTQIPVRAAIIGFYVDVEAATIMVASRYALELFEVLIAPNFKRACHFCYVLCYMFFAISSRTFDGVWIWKKAEKALRHKYLLILGSQFR